MPGTSTTTKNKNKKKKKNNNNNNNGSFSAYDTLRSEPTKATRISCRKGTLNTILRWAVGFLCDVDHVTQKIMCFSLG